MNTHQYEQAMQARDARFDGRFFIGVKTTGIYCRPICKVRTPLAKNVTFYTTAAAASEAGFRPCLRCRPETAPGTPAWMGTSVTVKRALRLISEGALNADSVTDLSDRLGVTSRHLGRLFIQHIGASPKAVGQTQRLHLAKKLLDETRLPIIDVAMSSGYQSVRRFNDHFKSVYKATPSSYRKTPRKKVLSQQGSGFHLKLAYRPPFDFEGILNFLSLRAVPGVEEIKDNEYRRTIFLNGEPGRLKVSNNSDDNCLQIHLELSEVKHLIAALERVKRLFDLSADPMEVTQHFSGDPQLAAMANQNPGQRVPGSWDPFEIAVRAIVGQQVSVKGATTVMGKIAKTYGHETEWGLRFPTAAELAKLDIHQLSMPTKRAQSIKDLSKQVASGKLSFDDTGDMNSFISQLEDIKGIGAWTAQYIAMRAMGDPNAFLQGDLVLKKVAKEKLGIDSSKALLERSKAWEPWRAYAGMHLWRQFAAL